MVSFLLNHKKTSKMKRKDQINQFLKDQKVYMNGQSNFVRIIVTIAFVAGIAVILSVLI